MMIVICAGNYREAKEYAKEESLGKEKQDWINATARSLEGLRGPVDVRYVGTYFYNKTVKERDAVADMLAAIEATS
jgi:hypothetical protein